jgi:hypothetical protein
MEKLEIFLLEIRESAPLTITNNRGHQDEIHPGLKCGGLLASGHFGRIPRRRLGGETQGEEEREVRRKPAKRLHRRLAKPTHASPSLQPS